MSGSSEPSGWWSTRTGGSSSNNNSNNNSSNNSSCCCCYAALPLLGPASRYEELDERGSPRGTAVILRGPSAPTSGDAATPVMTTSSSSSGGGSGSNGRPRPAPDSHGSMERPIPFVVPPRREAGGAGEVRAQERGLPAGGGGGGGGAGGGFDPGGVEPRRAFGYRPRESFALGSINPELYGSTGDEEGEWEHAAGPSGPDTPRLCFSLHYELASERLHVTLLKGRNLWLPGGVVRRAAPRDAEEVGDPLVKVFLLPDERRHVQSKVRRKTAHPTFNETFVFQVSHGSLSERTLRLSALAVDVHRKHRALGHALIPMRAHAQRCTRARLVLWRELDADALEPSSEHGDLHFSLSYNAYLSRLTVVVLRAKGLRFHGDSSELDVHVRATLLNQNQRVRDKGTGRARGCPSPLYNETLSFPLPPSNLDSSSLSLCVLQTGTGAGDGGELTLGRVVVGPFMYARGRGLEHWEEMIAKPKEMVKRWHALSPDS
ncbi:synaptotagmin-15-like isoform X2 [Lampetra planeri]